MSEEWKEPEAYTAPNLILLKMIEKIKELIAEKKLTEEDLSKFIDSIEKKK
jgi:hypothetical protein